VAKRWKLRNVRVRQIYYIAQIEDALASYEIKCPRVYGLFLPSPIAVTKEKHECDYVEKLIEWFDASYHAPS